MTRSSPGSSSEQSVAPSSAAPAQSSEQAGDGGPTGALRLIGLAKSFGTQQVLRDVTLSVPPGSTTAIVGPSGSGKTTMLRLIAGFERPDAGAVTLGGEVLASATAWVPPHHRPVGYVAQDGALFPHLTVGQNIAFGLDRSRLTDGRRGVAARVTELLEMVSLDGSLAKRRPHEISGGQQQRVALARALAREPRLMLLDESFSALDAGLRVATRRAVGSVLRAAGITTVLVTHDQAEALSFADQVAVMRDGMLSQVDRPLTVYTRPADRRTAEFLGDVVLLDGVIGDGVATCALGEVRVAPTEIRGRAQLRLRPEQIRVDRSGPICGVVLDSEFFGPQSTVRLRLSGPTGDRGASTVTSAPLVTQTQGATAGGETITIRHSYAIIATPGTELRLRIEGEAIAFPHP